MSPSRATSSHSQGAPSPPKPDQYEVLYNSAVQSFVRRDHLKTQATLNRLLAYSRQAPRDATPWEDLDRNPKPVSGGTASSPDWVIKTLKLAISANASLYSDPPSSMPGMQHLLPPASPTAMLEFIRELCVDTYGADLLPPQVLSTFLLAALKLRPAEPALGFAHQLAEDWLTNLPDSFVRAIARDARGPNRRRLETAREGYLKVVELFVGEVLGREGEWEMARGLLEGEMVMGSKKKEALYRHLRALENKSKESPSPASSMILPSPSDSGLLPSASISPSPTPKGKGRKRSDSATTSSSEATARPVGNPFGQVTSRRATKGKQRDDSEHGDDSTIQPPESEATAVPNKIYVRSPPSGHAGPSGSEGRGESSSAPTRSSALSSILPSALAQRLETFWRSGWMPFAIPLPVIAVLLFIYRRRQRAGRADIADIRDRLRRVRAQGIQQWVRAFLAWWAQKIAGVLRLGTTISYM